MRKFVFKEEFSPDLSPTQEAYGDVDREMEKAHTEVGSFKNLIQHRPFLINLIVLCINWIIVSTSAFILAFSVKQLNGNLYLNAFTLGTAVIFGYASSGIIRKCLNVK